MDRAESVTGRRSLLGLGMAAGLGTTAMVGCSTPPVGAADDSGPLNWVNVMSTAYGAKGDGIADDTAAVAAAYAAAHQQERPLYFPSGFYKLTSLPAFATGTTVIGTTSLGAI